MNVADVQKIKVSQNITKNLLKKKEKKMMATLNRCKIAYHGKIRKQQFFNVPRTLIKVVICLLGTSKLILKKLGFISLKVL